jgi:hypothetical protein
MSLQTIAPGLKPSATKRGLGAHLLTGGLLPPITEPLTVRLARHHDPKVPKVPVVPTIDTARENQQESDRIRRRKGVFANIFGGARASSPTVGTAALTGG